MTDLRVLSGAARAREMRTDLLRAEASRPSGPCSRPKPEASRRRRAPWAAPERAAAQGSGEGSVLPVAVPATPDARLAGRHDRVRVEGVLDGLVERAQRAVA